MFTLPPLPYSYNALEPSIDAKTMEIHYTKHHQAYVDKLNVVIAGTEREEKPLEEILQSIPLLPDSMKIAVKNNGGGHRNHTLFWQLMIPGGTKLSDAMTTLLTQNFGSVDAFKEQFSTAAIGNFGSGRTRLIKEHDELKIVNTANQNNPLMNHQKAILGLDTREHAYYLQYQNKRPDYIHNRQNVVNWEKVEELYGK